MQLVLMGLKSLTAGHVHLLQDLSDCAHLHCSSFHRRRFSSCIRLHSWGRILFLPRYVCYFPGAVDEIICSLNDIAYCISAQFNSTPLWAKSSMKWSVFYCTVLWSVFCTLVNATTMILCLGAWLCNELRRHIITGLKLATRVRFRSEVLCWSSPSLTVTLSYPKWSHKSSPKITSLCLYIVRL